MIEADVIKSKRYRMVLQKRYFEKGNGLFSVSRYVVFGGFIQGMNEGIYMLIGYSIVAYIVGRIWYKTKMPLYESEIGNQFNLLSRQLRKEVIN